MRGCGSLENSYADNYTAHFSQSDCLVVCWCESQRKNPGRGSRSGFGNVDFGRRLPRVDHPGLTRISHCAVLGIDFWGVDAISGADGLSLGSQRDGLLREVGFSGVWRSLLIDRER